MNEVTERPAQVFSLEPRNFSEAMQLADMLAASEMVPKDFRGKPANCLIAVQWGYEVGLKPLQALQNIAVINGRPSMWGDSLIALVRASPLCEYINETMDAEQTATCRLKRRGEAEEKRTFSVADAKTAGLWTKDGPWKTAPKRMLQMRARAFALRDVFADVLKGISMAEEAMDLPPVMRDMGPAEEVALSPLLVLARASAEDGREGFAAFWKACEPAQRGELRDQLPDLKERTEKAEAAKQETKPLDPEAAKVATEHAEFVDALDAASGDGLPT